MNGQTTSVDLVDSVPLTRKDNLRAAMRRRLAAAIPAERGERSHRLACRLVELPAWRTAATVLLFAPLPSEPDLDLLWQVGALAGKQVAYPRVDGTTMRLYHVASPDELEPTRWGLREPPLRAEREEMLDDVSLALVPGLAFDAAGRRLGRGGGFYDRLLARRDPAKTRVIGVGFAFQVSGEPLPTAAHDIRMDAILTD